MRTTNDDRWKANREAMLARVRSIVALPNWNDAHFKVRRAGRERRSGYSIEKLLIEPEPGIVLPALLFQGSNVTRDTLYLHAGGKSEHASIGGPIESYVERGHRVLAVDLRGLGETETRDRPRHANKFGANWKEAFTAYLFGQHMTGMRARDIQACVRYLETSRNAQNHSCPIGIVAIGDRTIFPALHVVALETNRFDRLEVHGAIPAWIDWHRDPTAPRPVEHAIHGALSVYDSKNLVECLPEGFLRGRH